jgi:hypothetical protein
VHLKVLFIIEIDRRLTRGQPSDRQSKVFKTVKVKVNENFDRRS